MTDDQRSRHIFIKDSFAIGGKKGGGRKEGKYSFQLYSNVSSN